jgi:hypothetical protein
VRRHRVVGHRAPRVVLWRRLREPDVARIPCNVPRLECLLQVLTVDELATGGVDDIRATLQKLQRLLRLCQYVLFFVSYRMDLFS